MLIYVDKKKERRQKIKKILLISGIILFLLINILHFNTALNQTSSSLQNIPLEKSAPIWDKAGVAAIFTAKNSKIAQIIIIPPARTRENFIITAQALSNIAPTANSVYLAPDLHNRPELLDLIRTFAPQSTPDEQTGAQLVIATNLNIVLPQIQQSKLFPKTINYTETAAIADSPVIVALLNRYYPLPQTPQTRLEKEKAAIKKITDKHHDTLKQYIKSALNQPHATPGLPEQDILLRNTPLCLTANNHHACTLQTNTSLQKNIKTALKQLTSPPIHISLLTSAEPITITSTLQKDEGLLFKFEQREALLLPAEITNLSRQNPSSATTANLFRYLMLQAGINPDYTNPNMQFYKFKTVEIEL